MPPELNKLQIGDSTHLSLGSMNVLAIYPGFGASLMGAFLSRGDAIQPQVIIENRDYAVANLISHMESGHLPSVPIWDDLATFNAIPWSQRVDLVLANFAHLGLEDIPLNLGELLVGLGSPRVIMEFRPEVLASRDGFIAFCGRLQSLDFELSITEISASDLGLQHGRKRLFMVLTSVSTGSHVANPRQQGMERRSGLGTNSQENQAGQRSRLIGDSDPSMDRVERLIRQLPIPPAPRDTEDWKHVLESWPDFSPTLPESVDGHFHGMADGISDRMERLWILGTSSVPQVWSAIISSIYDS